MQFTPFEEHSSSAAAPHHCGRCLLVVTLHPCVTARSRRSYRTRDRSYPLEQALENVSVTTHTKTAPEPSSLSQRRTTLPWRPAGSETDTPRCDILRHTLPSESTARAHSRRSMRIEALEHLHSIPRSRRSGYDEHCTHGVSVNLTTRTPKHGRTKSPYRIPEADADATKPGTEVPAVAHVDIRRRTSRAFTGPGYRRACVPAARPMRDQRSRMYVVETCL